MPKKESDMLREQRRRRRDLLELKSAEMTDAAPKKEEYSAPRTLKEKIENFWYHNKWGVVALAAVLLVVGVCTWQMLSRPKYDCQVVLYISSFVDKPTSDALQAELEKYCPDTNGDGEVHVLIVDCCVYEGMQNNQLKDVLDRVQAQLMDPDSVIYIVDDNTLSQLDGTAPEIFEKRNLPSISGRGINLAGTELDQAVQKADSANLWKGDYYIARRHFNEDNIIKPSEESMASADALIDNILMEMYKEKEMRGIDG